MSFRITGEPLFDGGFTYTDEQLDFQDDDDEDDADNAHPRSARSAGATGFSFPPHAASIDQLLCAAMAGHSGVPTTVEFPHADESDDDDDMYESDDDEQSNDDESSEGELDE